MGLKNCLFKHKRKLITLFAVSIFLVSMYLPVFLSFQNSTNINYLQTLFLNKLPNNNNNINFKDFFWLSGWNYRKSHTIIGSTAGALTNYQIRIVVHYGSGTDSGENIYCNNTCRTDFGDVRFTKSDGTTLLNYWLESKTDGDKATFWVKVDSIPASPSTVTIYVYYGKSAATTTSSGDNTFIYFTDFSGNSLPAGWSQKCNNVGGYAVENSLLKVWTDNTSHNFYQYQAVGYNVGYGYNISLLTKIAYMNKALYKFVRVGLTSDNNTSEDSYDLTHYISAGGSWDGINNVFKTYESPYSTETGSFSFSSGDILELARAPDKCFFYQNHVLEYVHNSSYPSLPTGNLYIDVWGISGYSNGGPGEIQVDWEALRNYADPEPTNGAWGSPESAPVIWNNTIITDTQIIIDLAIILNGNLTIASGGSLTLTNVTLSINCASTGSNYIEVQSGGALFINDTDRNPLTRNDATNITAYNPNYNFNFYVRSGATFQMNNSELHYCGYWDNDYNKYGLAIDTNNAIIENNTITNGYSGIILQNAQYNKITNNNVSNSAYGIYLYYYCSYNTITGNTFANNSLDGLHTFTFNNHNTYSNNTAINNAQCGFALSYSSYENFTYNTAINNGWYGVELHETMYSTVTNNNATNNGEDGFWITSWSDNNTITNNIAISNNRYDFRIEYSHNNSIINNIVIAPKILGFCICYDNSSDNDYTGCIVENYLRVQVLNYTGMAVQGADVKVDVDGTTFYASPGFGGSNLTTDQNGLTGWILVPYQTYINETTIVENITNVEINCTGLYFSNNPRIANMSTSHTETFTSSGPIVTITTPSSDTTVNTGVIYINGTYNGQGNNIINITCNNTNFTLQTSAPYGATGNYSFMNNTPIGTSDFWVQVTVTDQSNQTRKALRYVIVDQDKPVLNITIPVSDSTVNTGVIWINGTYNGTGSSVLQINCNDSHFTLRITPPFGVNGAFYFSNNTPISTSSFYIQVNVSDGASLVSSVVRLVVVDQNPPSVTVTSPFSNTTINVGTIMIRGYYNDTGSGVKQINCSDPRFTLQSGTQFGLSGTYVFVNNTPISTSNFWLNVTVIDGAGLWGSAVRNVIVNQNGVVGSGYWDISSGLNQYVNASVAAGVELYFNTTSGVRVYITGTTANLGGSVPSGFGFLGNSLSILANDTNTLQNIMIIIHYTQASITNAGLDESSLRAVYWDETSGGWIELQSTVDTSNNIVTANTNHLSNFAILGTLIIPSGIPTSLYLPFILISLLAQNGPNPLIYLALGLVAVAVVTVAALGLRGRREEQAPELEAPARYARATPQTPTRYPRAQTPQKSGEEAPERKIVLKVRRTTPLGETQPTTATKRAKTPKTRLPVGDLEARRVALRDLMDEVNARFGAGKLTQEEYLEIYTKYRAKLASVEKKLGRFESRTSALGKSCCLFCGSEITGDAKYCTNCGGARLKCTVCQQQIASGDPLVRCPHCGVLGHREHLLEWIKVKGYCPSCKKKLREADII